MNIAPIGNKLGSIEVNVVGKDALSARIFLRPMGAVLFLNNRSEENELLSGSKAEFESSCDACGSCIV